MQYLKFYFQHGFVNKQKEVYILCVLYTFNYLIILPTSTLTSGMVLQGISSRPLILTHRLPQFIKIDGVPVHTRLDVPR